MVVSTGIVTCQEESLGACLLELATHWKAHRDEVGPRRLEMTLDVDLDFYATLEAAGKLSVVIMRVDGALVGYFISVVHGHPHYKQTLCAFNDVFFIQSSYRHQGYGEQLFRAAEGFLKARSVELLFADDKIWKDTGHLFARCGWEPTGTLYTKWIGA